MGLLDKQLIVVSGKGGVGKSTIAAALALKLSSMGRRTLICEVNADERIAPMLGHPAVGPELTQLEESLWAVDVRPQEAMREYALMILKFKSVYRAVFENRMVRYFLRFIPSLQELVLLGKILFHAQQTEPDGRLRFDHVIVDAPATGHALTFLSVPRVLVQTVPSGAMSAEAEKMRAVLEDPTRAAAVLVSLPEEMPVNETIELRQALDARVGLRTEGAVLNAFVAPRFSEADEQALSPFTELKAVASAHRARAQCAEEARRRLERELKAHVHPVPRLFVEVIDRAALATLGEHLSPLLSGAA